jgi:copper homeostasis protein
MQVQVEVCVASVEEAEVAAACGADRLEICSWLACGGITPSSGLVDTVRNAVRVPVRVLVRPTPGGFHYSAAETAVLLTDAEVFGGGALGLVTGALDEAGDLHVAIMRSVIDLAPESEITFHRAIDRCTDPIRVVDACIELGIDRILTSGGATLATDGVSVIQRIIKHAGERCAVTIAGGIGPANVVELVERTGAQEIHFAAQRTISGPVPGASMSSSQAGMNFLSGPDAAKIEGVLNALVKAGLR